MDPTEGLAFDYTTERIEQSRIIHADCLEWLSRLSENTLHAIVTDGLCGGPHNGSTVAQAVMWRPTRIINGIRPAAVLDAT